MSTSLISDLRAPDMLRWSLLCCALFPAYALVFWLDGRDFDFVHLTNGAINAGSLWLVGVAMRGPLKAILSRGRAAIRIPMILLGAFLVSFLWYLLVASILGWASSGFRAGGMIPDLGGPAFRWQLLQGFIAAGALLAFVEAAMPQRVQEPEREDDAEPTRSHLLLREDDEMVRIAIDDIVSIIAADEQVSIDTGAKSFRSRKRLSELESQLPSDFVRIHRSTIVNLNRVERIEPAGSGRMTVHLANGSAPIASRAGARLLKSRVI